MKEQLIAFETAKLAGEKGFDVKTKHWYDQTEALNPVKGIRGAMVYINQGYAPTQSLLQKWLREEKDIFINIETLVKDGDFVHAFDIVYLIKTFHVYYDDKRFDSYEEALEAGLQEALKLIS
jgi:hypothetical protein